MKDNEMVQKFLLLLKKDKSRNIIIIIGIIGIVLIYLSTIISPKKEDSPESVKETAFSASEYEEQLEKKLQRVVAAITGEENPEIMITLEGDTQYVYAADEKSKINEENGGDDSKINHDIEKTYIVLKDAQGNQHALTVTEMQPEVRGVVVVSKSANDAVTQEKIINAVKTVLGIPSSKIFVAPG